MTNLAVDTFSRANQSGWGTCSDGTNTWGSPVNGSATASISSNEGVFGNFNNDTQIICGSHSSTTDVNLLIRTSTTNTGNLNGLLWRYTSASGGSGYRAGFYGGTNVNIDKYTAGSRTNINGFSFSYSANTYYWLRIVHTAAGSLNVRAWTDGSSEPSTWNMTLTETTYSSGDFGVSIYITGASTANFDHLTVTDNSSSPTNNVMSATDSLTATDSVLATDTTLATDALSAVDIGNMRQWGVDALSVVDSQLATDQASALEALSVAESTSYVDGGVFAEQNSASDVLAQIGLYGPSEALTATDSLTESAGYQTTESLSLLENLASSASAIWTEITPVSDQLATTGASASTEQLSTSDILTGADVVGFADVVSVSDLGTLQGWGVDLLSVADSATNTAGYSSSEGLSSADSTIATDTTSGFVELLSAADSGGLTQTPVPGLYAFVEQLTIIDSALMTDSAQASDLLSVVDAQVTIGTSSFTDAGQVGDIGSLQVWPVESLTLMDTFAQTATTIVLEPLQTAEQLVTADDTTPGFLELLPLTDAGGLTQTTPGGAYTFVEQLLIADSLLMSGGLQVSDQLSTTDNQLAGHAVTLLDSLSVSDVALQAGGIVAIEGLSVVTLVAWGDSVLCIESLSASDGSFVVVVLPRAVVAALFRDGQTSGVFRSGRASVQWR